MLTPSNSQGTCSWCVVEHVRFERNVVRNVAAGINLLGCDNGRPSQQAADIAFRQNLFTMSTTLGGNGWFLQIGDATSAAGSCVLKSGTLSYGRSTVALNVTGVAALNSIYDPQANHTPTAGTTALTLLRP